MTDELASNVVPLGERLRRARAERGLSQAQAARELDVARTAYRLWELEASKPAPDRWRLIASWLGISVSTMLLAEDLIDDQNAEAADRIAQRALQAGEDWDHDVDKVGASDFFEQERSKIARQARRGFLTDDESSQLFSTLERSEANLHGQEASPAASARFYKELHADPTAPSLARSALLVTAAGLPDDVIEDAELLTSELVTMSVDHAPGGSIGIAIAVLPGSIRVEVTDQRDRHPTNGRRGPGWGLAVVAGLAARWGAGREERAYATWFEIDLPRSEG